jgi:uncharacterized membrane protein (DUF2068 family)
MDWSLLGCGHHGHVTYAPAEPSVRKRLCAQTPAGEAWRCLRCDTYVSGPPMASGPAAQAPSVRRGKELRSAFILRVFAVERFVRGLVAGALAYFVWRFAYSRESVEQAFNRERPILRDLFHQFGYNIDNSKLFGSIQHALTLSPNVIKLLAAGLALYMVIEMTEAVGLWLYRRWGEYFAMVATSLGLPYEIYDLVQQVTVPRVLFFAVNLALVLYLVITKRLFGVRGGKHAYEARLRSESIMAAAIEAAAAEGPAPADADPNRRPPAAQSPAQDPSRPATQPTAPTAAGPTTPQTTEPAARTARA